MAAKHIFGLAKLEMGDIAGDGGVATSFEEVGETVVGSATMTAEEGTTTDFFIEESDSAVESVESTPPSLKFNWSTSNVGGYNMNKFFGGTYVAALGANRVATFGTLTGGTGYANGTYTNVPLTGGTGTGATANFTIAGGVVTVTTLVDGGAGYTAGDVLGVLAANVGGTGSGFARPAATVTASAVAESYELPDALPSVEKSIRATDKKGNVVVYPRVKIKGTPTLSFTKDALGQIDLVGTILQPTKAGTKRMKIVYAA